jgi:uncharacterized delta-60 repeat protein
VSAAALTAVVVGALFPAGVRAAPGDLDLTFSGDGKQTTAFAGPDGASGVALQPDGKIVAVGGTATGGYGYFAVARYKPDGSLDPSFSGDGKRIIGFGAQGGATAVAIQSDGKIVAVGRAGGGGFALARLNPDGSLDASFSGDGRQTTAGGHNQANAVALQGDGKIVVVGGGGGFGLRSRAFVLARYNPDGSLDTSFSGDGIQTTDFVGHDEARAVAIQTDGKILAAGFARDDFALARYNPDGSPDTGFADGGKRRADLGGADFANGVALQGNGKIVAAGSVSTTGFAFGIARFNANGTLDKRFSGDGRQTTTFGGFDSARGVAIQGDSRIVAVGISAAGSLQTRDFAVARYNTNGSLDTSFSGDGKQTTDFGGDDEANGVALEGDGRIVAAGSGLGTDGSSDFALARYMGG